ncbi:D-alanyl-lipoteichoic acid biosynthesis protein DltB [uncultured Ruminococcus sp.]|nr:D-alanyl-lipoteichoic acid biosynthesis protein DltB [uncultured Ruminococcus sp.]
MIFSSLFFIFIFLPLVLAAYYLVPRKFKNLCLVLFSLVFYAWGEPIYVLLMIFTILVDYACGLCVARFIDRRGKAKLFITINIVINLALLGFFKYAGMLVGTFDAVTGLGLSIPEVALPIGISFYTFESMSYAIDVYRREAPAMRNIIDFAAYLSFFPHLVAGPIVRYEALQAQVLNRRETLEKFTEGTKRFLTGLFKKVLIADNLAILAERVQYLGTPSTLTAWMGILAFTFQIYFDFSGYSDMAIGLGKMFGFELPENFDHPYVSQSVSEFWRRWHMTLGGWFREYVYIPLGGNRKGRLCTVRNLAIVWVLTGMWHGASWNFAFWGAYYAVLIILEKLFLQKKVLDKIPAFFRWLYSFLAAAIGWLFFSYTDIGQAFSVLASMFGFAPEGATSLGLYALLTYGLLMLIAALCSGPLARNLFEKLRNAGTAGKVAWALGVAGLFIITLSFLVNSSYSPFLYAKF